MFRVKVNGFPQNLGGSINLDFCLPKQSKHLGFGTLRSTFSDGALFTMSVVMYRAKVTWVWCFTHVSTQVSNMSDCLGTVFGPRPELILCESQSRSWNLMFTLSVEAEVPSYSWVSAPNVSIQSQLSLVNLTLDRGTALESPLEAFQIYQGPFQVFLTIPAITLQL